MADVAPFRGVHYNLARVGELSAVVAPPYDIIRAPLQEELYHRSPYNVVRLILGRDLPDDDPGRNKYLRAALQYRQWLEDRVLVRDAAPSFYLYHIEFELKTPAGVRRLQRRGLLGRLRLSPYSERVVLPHERTLAAPKEDRFRLLSAARVVFSPVFVLFQDPAQELAGRLEAAAGPESEVLLRPSGGPAGASGLAAAAVSARATGATEATGATSAETVGCASGAWGAPASLAWASPSP